MLLSIVIPVLNEAGHCRHTLLSLQRLRNQVLPEHNVELILVDGGSRDNTLEEVIGLVDKTVVSGRGRARQMNTGADLAQGEYLLFLHADTQLPVDLIETVTRWRQQKLSWGYFSLRLSGRHWLLRVVEQSICWRSRVTGIGTGDQCLFVKRSLFESAGGFPELPLMEDVALCKILRKHYWPIVERSRVCSSSRRWEQRGIVRTILLMWSLRLAYFLGGDPRRLAAIYYPASRPKNLSQP